MQSPLPDSTALEAGIIPDSRPSRLSRVHDNVRHLLRSSTTSVPPSPRNSAIPDAAAPTLYPTDNNRRPGARRQVEYDYTVGEPITPTTTNPHTRTPSTASSTSITDVEHGVLFPPTIYSTPPAHHQGYQSSIFNGGSRTNINHPDLSNASLALFLQAKSEERQHRAWRRSRHGHGRRQSKGEIRHSTCLLMLSGFLLVGLIATYLIIATMTHHLSPTFHVLFVLGILAVTIVFVHTLVRMCMRRSRVPGTPRMYGERPSHRHHGHHDDHRHASPFHSRRAGFVPSAPIAVLVGSDEDSHNTQEARPSSEEWDKEPGEVSNPPPAYGRWRGSVRANPDLLHWQPIPSPIDAITPTLPSPSYEELAEPPSYMNRGSPARRRDVQTGEPGDVQAQDVDSERINPTAGSSRAV